MNKMNLCMGTLMAIGAASCGGVESTSGDSPSSTGSSALLFSDPSNSGPRLDVYDFNGEVGVSVSGPIGTQADVLPSLTPNASLVELYRTLHPTASSIPSELTVLDQRVGPSLKAALASARPAGAAQPQAVEDKSLSGFSSTVCVTFGPNVGIQYQPVECKWSGNTSIQITGWSFTIPANDRAYGWNNKSTPAQIQWFLNGASSPSGVTNLPAFYWNWSSMLGGGPYQARMVSSTFGEMGLTHHAMALIVR